MKRAVRLFLAVVLTLLVPGCTRTSSPTASTVTEIPRPTSLTPSSTVPEIPRPPSSPTSVPSLVPGRTIVVSSTADRGPGSLRQAIESAQTGDIILFDSEVFPLYQPSTIGVTAELPPITQGSLTVDASNAGVVLDGGLLSRDKFVSGLELQSPGNAIRGLQVINFPGAGIAIAGEDGRHNLIGGDPNLGSGPIGQGNLTSANEFGIGMWDSATANVITGNLIGTDSSGADPLGNRGAGVWISEGASRNVVGPNNLVAHNGGDGVRVEQASSIGNTITANGYLGNRGGAIRVDLPVSSAPAPPLIWDSDLAAGTVTGAVLACPGCQVEIFSDGGSLGTVFEAQTAADPNGDFTFDAGRPLAGPSLRATVTAADGSTSEFSIPATGTVQSVGVLQEGNVAPREVFVARMGHELEDTKIGSPEDGIGTVYECADALSASLDSRGHTWLRLSFGPGEWSDVHGTGPGEWSEVLEGTGRYTPMSFSECQERLIDDLVERGFTIAYNLIFFDEQLQVSPDFLRFRTDQEVHDFLDYARMVITHLRGRVEYYLVWNEPNIENFGQQSIALPDYLDMVRRLVPVIRAADPDAKIVVGDTSDLRSQDVRDYTMGIVESDIMPLVDGVALHPMFGSSPDYDELRQYYYDYDALIQTIMDAAATHGFTGEYFATEMNWRTPGNTNDYEVWSYSETVAAKYYARGITINRGLGMWVTIFGEGPTAAQVVRNLNTVLAGAEPAGLPMEIETASDLARSYTFSLSNGDRLIALWIDGVGVDSDPGTPATVTVEGLTASEVTGIDVLYGYQQEIVTQMEDGNLVIHDMLVRDYPILLRLSGVKSTR